jgi:hypothetical protein
MSRQPKDDQAKTKKPRTIKKERARLVPHRIVAQWMSIDPETLRQWVHKGHFPEPHSIISQTWFYPMAAIEQYLEHGTWPTGTRFKSMARATLGREGEDT